MGDTHDSYSNFPQGFQIFFVAQRLGVNILFTFCSSVMHILCYAILFLFYFHFHEVML